jgi:hypothetical protein
MKPMLPAAAAHEYLRQREALLQAFPELAEDEIALRDTLDGITYAPDLVALFVRDALEDESLAEALALRIKAMNERKTRLLSRSDRRRLAAQNLMQACDIRKVEQPDFTASIRNVPPKVEIDDEAALPDALCKVVRQPDKAAIKEALATGAVTGARLTNGSETLTIRTK